jgi:hypothetical protein
MKHGVAVALAMFALSAGVNSAWAQGMPAQGMPAQGMPAQGMPAQGMPAQGMPAQGMPTQGTAAQCGAFQGLSAEAQKRADVVGAALKNKATDRKELCGILTSFVGAEAKVVKFLEDNRTWCGVPDQALTASKANHAKSIHFQQVVCSSADAPKPKAPTLSDAIKTLPTDSAANTKTGHGTFDTLTGNPLAK